MPRTKKNRAADAALPQIPAELIDQIVKGPVSVEAVSAASSALKKALIERCLGAELSDHLGYRPGADRPEGTSNHRNGMSGKTVLTEDGPLRIEVPRDREGSFEPVLIVDALRVKIHEEAVVRNKAVYLALGVLPDAAPPVLLASAASPSASQFGVRRPSAVRLSLADAPQPAASPRVVAPALCVSLRASPVPRM